MKARDKRIDWAEVKNRLRVSQLALERALTEAPERVTAVFQQRAAQLAGRGTQAVAVPVRVLVFQVGAERYGIEIGDLAGVLPCASCTPVPGGPPPLLGVTNMDGEIRSVVDLGRLLELPEGDNRPAGYILLIRRQKRQAALRVDQVDQIQPLAPGAAAGPVPGEVGPVLHFLKGLSAEGLRLLNTDAVLDHPLFQGTF